MDRKGTARWQGDLKQGSGTLRLGSGAFEGPYSFATRFENAPGTNPEELIAAAHAACFSMAFAAGLSRAGFVPQTVETTATVHLGKIGEASAITGIDLVTHAVVPGISPELFQQTAEDAKAGCPVSRALAAVPITLRLTGGAG
jgi:osmotically inducible protein OsmC